MITITGVTLGEIIEENRPDLPTTARSINAAAEMTGIGDTVDRLAHFISQSYVESKFKPVAENMNYSKKRMRGLIQVTGRYNYEEITETFNKLYPLETTLDFVRNPELLLASGISEKAAAAWWHNNKINILIDGGASVRQVTKKVNGGKNHLKKRNYFFNRAKEVIERKGSANQVRTLFSPIEMEAINEIMHL